MADSTQIPQSLNGLGDIIRAIESESGQHSQLVVKVGDDRYLVGDIGKRAGEYRLEMQDEYPLLKGGQKQKNPHKKLAGTYSSFDELKKAIEGTQSELGRMRGFFGGESNPIYLIRSPDYGYLVSVPGLNMGRAGGQTYVSIGRIIFPFLQKGEKVTVDKLER